MAKPLPSFVWIEEHLPDGYFRKRMFGGLAYYMSERLIFLMFESPGDRQYKDKIVDYDIWNGCMIPVEKELHQVVMGKFPFLVEHPVLPKWLYLPASVEDFDELILKVVRDIGLKPDLYGTVPAAKGKTKSSKKKNKIEKDDFRDVDTRTPSMFRDEDAQEKLARAKKISDLKNLGVTAEKHFQQAGIKSVQHFVKLGWQGALKKLVALNPKHRHSIYTYALIGALKNQDWNGISDQDKAEARAFTASLKGVKFTQKATKESKTSKSTKKNSSAKGKSRHSTSRKVNPVTKNRRKKSRG